MKFTSLHTIACLILTIGAVAFFISCNSPFTPKPRGYFKINFPKKEYKEFKEAGYPYSFEYPVYAEIIKDTVFFNEQTENPWWININFPQFNGKVHISYKEVGKTKFDKLIDDAFRLTGKHSQKAYSIDDSNMVTPYGVHGVFFKVGGEVATANQFFLTDTAKHFLRGALYFDATPNEDSLSIVNSFLVEDLKHLINTFKWTDRPAVFHPQQEQPKATNSKSAVINRTK